VVRLRFCTLTSSSDSFCVVMLQSRSFLCQVTDSGKGFSCSPREPSQRSFRRDTPKGSQVDENDEAKRKAVPHVSACGSAAEGARLEWGYDAALGEALSSRVHNARPDHGPVGRYRTPCRRSIFVPLPRGVGPTPTTLHRAPLACPATDDRDRRAAVFGRKTGSINSHWASLSSHRPRMPFFCPL
jgi:hypothetical protein